MICLVAFTRLLDNSASSYFTYSPDCCLKKDNLRLSNMKSLVFAFFFAYLWIFVCVCHSLGGAGRLGDTLGMLLACSSGNLGCSWALLARLWNALGALWGALENGLTKNTTKKNRYVTF